jgi:hypothetical protein
VAEVGASRGTVIPIRILKFYIDKMREAG